MTSLTTAERIQDVALDLFARRGFDQVTVQEVATAAGVSHMTFFRHYPTKESVVLADPWDPAIATAVAAQPPGATPLARIRAGLLMVLGEVGDSLDDQTRLRIRLAAGHPGLRAAMWESNQQTRDAIVAALVETGVEAFDARVAAGACLGALMAALLDWGASEDEVSLGARVERALAPFEAS